MPKLSQEKSIELFGQIHGIFFVDSPEPETFCEFFNRTINEFDQETKKNLSQLISFEEIL